MRLLWVALGGAIGSAARYALDGAVYRVLPGTFPFGTWVVNISGCLIFGVLLGTAEAHFTVGSFARTLVLIGILCGFTTFSSFTFETLQLMRDGEALLALTNAAGQVLAGLVALWLGVAVGRLA